MNAMKLKREAKKTKMKQLSQIENMNRQAIEKLMQQDLFIAQQLNELKKLVFAIKACLQKARILDDFILTQAMREMEELQRMNEQALILGNKK